MRNKRSFKRIRLIYYLLVFKQDSDELVGHVVDIAPEGIKLMTKEPKDEGIIYSFRMMLPKEMEGEDREITFNALCVWSDEKYYADFYGSGYQFQNISDEDVAVIQKLIDFFGYQE